MRSWNVWPVKPAAQIIFFSLLFFGTIMYLHWEAMLISYLATRVTVLPFNGVPELVRKSQFRIIVTPGSSYEDDFKTAIDPDWATAWKDRVQPHLKEFMGDGTGAVGVPGLIKTLEKEATTAIYNEHFSVM